MREILLLLPLSPFSLLLSTGSRVTTSGAFDGVLGNPIIEYHHVDGTVYSDFMAIEFVTVPSNYTANDFKSVKDIMNSGATVTSADILINMPVVPTGSHLQHPQTKGINRAPIDPVLVWYNCVQVWTYVFEVSNAAAARHFESTQVATGRASGSGFDIAVTPDMRDPITGTMNAIPLWHVNQYSRGVTAATSGGPSPTGMRNVSGRRRNGRRCSLTCMLLIWVLPHAHSCIFLFFIHLF
jgi:hypothetical protein